MKETLRMVFVLFFVCIISAGSLSFLYVYTKPRIEQNNFLKEISLKQQILPEAKNFVTKQINGRSLEECYNEDKQCVGFIISSSCYGYGGEIKYIISITTTVPVRIKNIKIISHKETPGLGANITRTKFLSQFINKTADEIELKKDNPQKGKIDAITGATITSRAITKSIKKILEDEKLVKYITTTFVTSSVSTKVQMPLRVKPVSVPQEKIEISTSSVTTQ